MNNVRTARVSLRNPKLGRLNSAVIRGAVLQQGPKAFEFVVPRGFPISVCPQVGVVPLGKVRTRTTVQCFATSYYMSIIPVNKIGVSTHSQAPPSLQASFPGLPRLQFLIACSMQKPREEPW